MPKALRSAHTVALRARPRPSVSPSGDPHIIGQQHMRARRVIERVLIEVVKRKGPKGDMRPETRRSGLAVFDADAIATKAAVPKHAS